MDRVGSVVVVSTRTHTTCLWRAGSEPIVAYAARMASVKRVRLLRRRSRRRRVLVLGGARSGKSAFAEEMAGARNHVTYVATAPCRIDDPEWERRVADHQHRRPAHWRTLETTDLDAVLRGEPGPLLIDCATLWLTEVMDGCGIWADTSGADRMLASRIGAMENAWRATPAHAILVSNEAGCGVVPSTPAGRRFRDELGRLNTRLAACSDEVWLVTAGIPQRLR